MSGRGVKMLIISVHSRRFRERGGVSSETPIDHQPSFAALVRVVDAFVEAWEAGDEPPQPGQFLLADDAERLLMLVELIKVDLEYRWQQRNLPKRISEYLEEYPELASDGFPAALVYEEFHIRRNCGFHVEVEEYIEQFPDQADELQRLLGLNDAYSATTAYQPIGRDALNDITPGNTIDDFDVLAMLGEGAFAKVFLARQVSMQRMVALKISADRGQEPQTLAQFDHNNIVRVYDHRPDEKRGLWLLYMQYCPGGTIRDVIRTLNDTDPADRNGGVLLQALARQLDLRGESLPEEAEWVSRLRSMSWPEVVCRMGASLAEALEYAHSRGVLHRDIKPANVLLSRDGVPKLADFNISFSSKLDGASPTAYFGGSLAYMSIEQIDASNPACDREPESLDGRSDQYSLGVMLWELLTGRRPFADKTTSHNWSRTLQDMAERRRAGLSEDALAGVPDDCPPGVVRVLSRCLAPERDDRWSSGRELAHQLDLCRDEKVQSLLNPPAGSWRDRLQRYGAPAVVAAAAVPNILAGIFNFVYNHDEIVRNLGAAHQQEFWRVMTVINCIAYPLGLGILWWLTWKVVGVVRERQSTDEIPAERLRAASRWCLGLGHAAAVIGAVEWTVAGLAYPVAIHLAAGQLGIASYAHFIVSLILCGLVAVSYPFFGITAIALKVLYPQLIGQDFRASADVHLLERLNQRCWFYLVLAVSVPLVAIVTLSVVPPMKSRYALLALSGGTLFGFAAIYRCFRRLQDDVDALLGALNSKRSR